MNVASIIDYERFAKLNEVHFFINGLNVRADQSVEDRMMLSETFRSAIFQRIVSNLSEKEHKLKENFRQLAANLGGSNQALTSTNIENYYEAL